MTGRLDSIDDVCVYIYIHIHILNIYLIINKMDGRSCCSEFVECEQAGGCLSEHCGL